MNNQKPEKISQSATTIEYVDLFYTVQGEGPHAGRPAMFLRLAGCNLQCDFCDTDYTANRKSIDLDELVVKLNSLSSCRFLVITGGEPLRQREAVARLLIKLRSYYWKCQIETNGTMDVSELFADIVVSPKTRIHPSCYKRDDVYFKFLVSADTIESDDNPNDCNGQSIIPAVSFAPRVYLQPLDEQNAEKNKLNLDCVIRLAKLHNFRVSAQMHKIWGIA
jgi:organic radical activating enzyme